MVASVFRLDQPLLRQHPGGEGVRRPRQTGHAHRRTMDFMLSRHAWAKAGSAAAWAMYSRPTTAYRTFSPERGRFFSVRRPVYGESRSGFVWLLPLLPPRHGRLLHGFARLSHSGFGQLLFLRRELAAVD